MVSCPKGLAPFLAREVLSLGFPVDAETAAGVMTEGTLEDTMKLNLFLRTGHRVLYFLEGFMARGPEDLYRGISRIHWEEYIPADGYVCISSSVNHESIRDSRYANMKCKDALVDRIRAKCGRRPDSGPSREHAAIFFHWAEEWCSVYLDTSGEPLSRRGYRKTPLKAPLQETLAAAVVMATGWEGSGHFINPMCGSGTLAIEAALIGLNRAPGLIRDNYSFMHLRGFNAPLWERMKEAARAESKKDLGARIIATDINPETIGFAKMNASNAAVEDVIEFGTCEFADTPVPYGGGTVILNPEYGQRMGEEKDLGEIYKRIGDFFKQRCRGYSGYVFTGNPSLAKKVGLRAKRRVPFFNSTIECRLLEYELYEGSKKNRRRIDDAGSE